MSLAALFSWLITVSGGLYLLTIWLIEYDHEFQSGAATRLPVPVISTHALLAVTGLGLWGYYLFSNSTRLVWAAVAILAVVAVHVAAAFVHLLYYRDGVMRRLLPS